MKERTREQDMLLCYPSSVLENGYGIVGKIVMQDRRISATAKAIYAYLCTFGNVSYPGRDKICYDLGIGRGSYIRYMRQLVDCAYVTVQQRRDCGHFLSNQYRININPKEILERAKKEGNQEVLDRARDAGILLEEKDGKVLPKNSKEAESTKTLKQATSTVVQNLNHGKNTTVSHRGSNFGARQNGAPSNRAPSEVPHNNKRSNTTRFNTTTTKDTVNKTKRDKTTDVSANISVVVVSGTSEFLASCQDAGVMKKDACRFAILFGKERVLEKLKLLRAEQKTKNIHSPAGWLRRALENDYQEPVPQKPCMREKEQEAQKAAHVMQERLEESKRRAQTGIEAIESMTDEEIRAAIQKTEEQIAVYAYDTENNPIHALMLKISREHKAHLEERMSILHAGTYISLESVAI